VCNGCYQKGAVNHPHKLTNHPSAADRDAQNKEARQMRVSQVSPFRWLLSVICSSIVMSPLSILRNAAVLWHIGV
jgi:hypothetical protein